MDHFGDDSSEDYLTEKKSQKKTPRKKPEKKKEQFYGLLNLQTKKDSFDDSFSDEEGAIGSDDDSEDEDAIEAKRVAVKVLDPGDFEDIYDATVDDEGHVPKKRNDEFKIDVAQRIVTVLCGPGGGLPIVLSGGGAVTLSGGPRAIKDLDFRILLDPERTFRKDDELSTALIKGINKLLLSEFGTVRILKRADPKTGMTIKGYVEDVEVSITRTPKVPYLNTVKPTLTKDEKSGGILVTMPDQDDEITEVPVLGEFDLVLDKAYSFIARRKSDFAKRVTDLIDMLALFEQQPGMVIVLTALPQLRGEAYEGQFGGERDNKQQREKSPLLELSLQIDEILRDTRLMQALKELGMRKYYKLLVKLDRDIESLLKLPPPTVLG